MGALTAPLAAEIERVLIQGDIGKLTADQRMEYYRNMCQSLGLNPMTRPFEYLTLQGKTILYAKKDATDQLRKIHGVSITIASRESVDGVYVVTARAQDKYGRMDESLGALPLPQNATDRANAIMKCETKAKRRVTLSICGLGMLDESEIETIPGSKERQAEYLVTKGLEPYVANKKLPPAPSDAVIRELADTLDQPPQPLRGDPGIVSTRGEVSILVDGKHVAPTGKPPIMDIEMRAAKQVAEADAAIAEVSKPKKVKTGAVGFDVLKHFGLLKEEMREEFGDDTAYYRILQGFGYEKSNAIRDNDQAREIYKAMAAERNRLKQEKELLTTMERASEVIGARAFADVLGSHGCSVITEALALAGDPLAALLAELKDRVDQRKGTSV